MAPTPSPCASQPQYYSFFVEIIAAIIVLTTLTFCMGVWAVSEVERRAFLRTLRCFDDVTTRTTPVLTPKIRISAYRSFIDRTRRQTLRIFQGRPLAVSKEEQEALQQRHCVLRFRSIAPEGPDEDSAITQKIKR